MRIPTDKLVTNSGHGSARASGDSYAIDDADTSRRHFLTLTTSVVGAVAVAGLGAAFIDTWRPSGAVLAAGAPINVKISAISSGQMITVSWRRRPVFILHRTTAQLETLRGLTSQLRDPNSEQPQQFGPAVVNDYRSIKPEFFVCVGICTHLGCTPEYRSRNQPGGLGASWKGGYFCPCHGSRYDLAGRVFTGVPAPLNLPVPPYYYLDDAHIRIGELANGSDRNWSPTVW